VRERLTQKGCLGRSMRKYAWLRGLSLSDHGLNQVVRDKIDGISSKTVIGQVTFNVTCEKDIFDLLRVTYVEPMDRHSGTTATPVSSLAP
jgi:hypothetical protein